MANHTVDCEDCGVDLRSSMAHDPGCSFGPTPAKVVSELKPLEKKDLSAVTAALTEISDVEAQAVDAVSTDAFAATIRGHYLTDQLLTEDRATLRRIMLGVFFRKISLQVQRCASMGVALSGYEDADTWIEGKIALLPEPKSDG